MPYWKVVTYVIGWRHETSSLHLSREEAIEHAKAFRPNEASLVRIEGPDGEVITRQAFAAAANSFWRASA
jgi:hypothetical protein